MPCETIAGRASAPRSRRHEGRTATTSPIQTTHVFGGRIEDEGLRYCPRRGEVHDLLLATDAGTCTPYPANNGVVRGSSLPNEHGDTAPSLVGPDVTWRAASRARTSCSNASDANDMHMVGGRPGAVAKPTEMEMGARAGWRAIPLSQTSWA